MLKLIKWLNDYMVYSIACLVFFLAIILYVTYLSYRDNGKPRNEYRKKEIHDVIEWVYLEPYKGGYISHLRFKKLGELRMWDSFDDYQVGDSVVKEKNQMRLRVFRMDTLFFDSAKF